MGLHHAFRVGLLPAAIVALGLAVAAGGERFRAALRYDRAGIDAAEYYRLVSGHFAHLGWSHFALNAAGLVLVWLLVGTAYTMLQWLFVVALVLIAIDAGFWLLMPGLDWYVGLSGLLHGLLTAGAVGSIARRRSESLVILAVLAAKLGYEILAGPLPGTSMAAGGAVVTQAHLFGALGGLVASGLIRIGNRGPAPI